MTEAIFTYLNHRLEIQLPDPTEDNTIKYTIERLPGTYDDTRYHSYFGCYQFSAANDDPNLWVVEAISSAIQQLAFSEIEYYTQPQEPYVAHSGDESDIFSAEF